MKKILTQRDKDEVESVATQLSAIPDEMKQFMLGFLTGIKMVQLVPEDGKKTA